MKILITGGAGYIGGALTDALKGSANKIAVYDSLLFEDEYRKDIQFIKGDIRDTRLLGEWLDWADCVVWLASIVGDGACALDPYSTKIINQYSVQWLANNFNGRIIHMSTCSVYGASDGVLDEISATNPLSIYAQTKLASEAYLKDKNAIIFRLGTLHGLGDCFSRIRLDLVVNTMTARAVSEGSLKVFGGEQYRPLLHVRDVAETIADNIRTEHTGVYNLHKENVKMIDLAKQVTELVPSSIELENKPFEDNRNYRVSSELARSIGFQPSLTAEDSIKELSALLQQGRIKDLNNPRYSNQKYMELFNGIN